MAFELIAALIAAAVLGLMAWALRRWVPSLPKWLVPFAGAMGLIGFTIWSEYDWFDRVSATLPATYQVVDVQEEAMPLRPWTYLKPIRMRFLAIDRAKTMTHPTVAGLRIVTLYSFARWKSVQQGLMAVDCAGNRQVWLTDGVKISDDGTLTGAEWLPVDKADKLQEAACQEG
ncbi:MAG: hypothetical protein WAT09_06920 [Paracoccaceae bacterium]